MFINKRCPLLSEVFTLFVLHLDFLPIDITIIEYLKRFILITSILLKISGKYLS